MGSSRGVCGRVSTVGRIKTAAGNAQVHVRPARHGPALLSVVREPTVAAVVECRGSCFRWPCSWSVSVVLLVAVALEPVLGSSWWTSGRVGSLQPSWLVKGRA